VPSQRKPLSGHLSLRIHAVADVDHAATGRFSRGPETFVNIKVEDSIKGRTKPSRNDRWLDELHEFDIDKANEIEVTVYDKTTDHPLPIGLLWVRISDIAEEMRRKKVETELQNSGWVSADKMGGNSGPQPDLQFQPPPGQNFASASGPGGAGMPPPGAAPPGAPQPQMSQIFIDDWFSLEPVGRVHLTMSFGTMSSSNGNTLMLTRCSETREKQEPVRCWTWPKGCHSSTERRDHRAIRSQVRATTVLQHHALCTLWRVSQVRCWHAMFGLQVYLSQEMLPGRGDKVYHAVERRNRPRRGEAEPSHPASLHKLFQHGRKLVLPLRVHLAIGPQAGSKVLR
jgi:hypothetical protein